MVTVLAVPTIGTKPVEAASAQLVANSSVETVSASNRSLPASWAQAQSGKFRVTFSHPTSGARTGTRFVRVAMSSYTSGWAGWRFNPVAVVAGSPYAFTTWYRSTKPVTFWAEYRTAAGVLTSAQVAAANAASGWTSVSANITPPSGTATLTVVPRLAAIGSLDIDDTTLTGEVPSTPLPAPAAPVVCATAVNQLAVQWSTVTGAASYELSYAPQGAAATVVTGLTTTSRSITGLAPGAYVVKVRAVPASGASVSPSNWSSDSTATVVASLATSLLANGSFELSDSTCASPLRWIKGGWGTNTATLSSPMSGGRTGNRYSRVQISSYSSGDAKWAFDHVPVTPGAPYTFTDWYRSNIATQLTVEYRSTGGVMTYAWLKDVPAATAWTPLTATFTPPAGTASVSVFHLVAGAGWLDVDDASLTTDSSVLPPPSGLSATSSSADRFTASWNAVSGAAAYDLRYSGTTSTGSVVEPQVVASIAASPSTVTALAAGWYSVQVRAVSSSSTSAWSAATNVSVGVTGTPPIPGLPSKFVAGYLEGWNLALPSTLPTQYEVLYHAFAPINGDGSVGLYLSGVSRSALATEYKARRAAGLPTLLSIGGGGGSQVGLGTVAQQQAFLNSVRPLIDEFGFSGIDWDLEAGIPGGISASGLVTLSRQLRAEYGSGFLITMAPYGDPTVETPLRTVARELAASGDLAYVGFQFYNDNAPTTSSVLAKMNSWIADCGIRADQFVLGFWAGPWDWPAGYVMSEATMASIYQGVRAVHPTLRGTYTWGIRGTDRLRNWAYATTMWPVVHSS